MCLFLNSFPYYFHSQSITTFDPSLHINSTNLCFFCGYNSPTMSYTLVIVVCQSVLQRICNLLHASNLKVNDLTEKKQIPLHQRHQRISRMPLKEPWRSSRAPAPAPPPWALQWRLLNPALNVPVYLLRQNLCGCKSYLSVLIANSCWFM